MVGAVISFGVGRLLGRDAVDRLVRGRLVRVVALLTDDGLFAVLLVRLVPVVPFIAINYASGLSGVRFRHFVLAVPSERCRAASLTQRWGPMAPNRGVWPPQDLSWLSWWLAGSGGARTGLAASTTLQRTEQVLDPNDPHRVLDRPLSELAVFAPSYRPSRGVLVVDGGQEVSDSIDRSRVDARSA